MQAQTLHNALVLSRCGEKFSNQTFVNIPNWTFDRNKDYWY